MAGAQIYLTQREMRVILEALDMLESDYGESEILKQVQPEIDSVEKKIYEHWVP